MKLNTHTIAMIVLVTQILCNALAFFDVGNPLTAFWGVMGIPTGVFMMLGAFDE